MERGRSSQDRSEGRQEEESAELNKDRQDEESKKKEGADLRANHLC